VASFFSLLARERFPIYFCRMKTHPATSLCGLLLTALGALALSSASLSAQTTAFALFRDGDRYVGEEAKGRLIEIRSDKSIGSLMPEIWYIVYFDPTSKGRGTEVKFAAGKKVSVQHWSGFLGMEKKPRELPKEKLLVDSDTVLRTALAEPLLKNLTMKATQLTLEEWEGLVVWKVRLWAAKLHKPEEMVVVGDVFIDAADGKVLKSNLKIKRVD
jgi:hypothetical protein